MARLTIPTGGQTQRLIAAAPNAASKAPASGAVPANPITYPLPRIITRAENATPEASVLPATPTTARESASPATSTLELRFFDAAAAVAALDDDALEIEPEAEPVPRATTTRERIGQLTLLLALGAAFAIVGAAAATRNHEAPPVTLLSTTIVPSAAKHADPAPIASDSAPPTTPPSPPAVAPPAEKPTTGTVLIPARFHGQPIVVDGNLGIRAQPTLVLECGHHQVRAGARGKLVTLDVPCGGTVALP